MKKTLSFLIGFLIILSTLPAVFADSFPDVPDTAKNFTAIEYLKAQGFVTGYVSGNFGPDDNLTRAQAAKVIVEAFGVEKKDAAAYEEKFADVKAGEWYFPYVMAGVDKTMIKGYEDGQFKPNQNVRLVEALKMMLVAGDIQAPEVSGNVFADVPAAEWFASHVQYARDMGIVISDSKGQIGPQHFLTRAEFAELVYRLKRVQESGGKEFPLYEEWKTYATERVPFKINYDQEEWQVIENGQVITFFNRDEINGQSSAVRTYPNSAKLTVSVDLNKDALNADNYFSMIKNSFAGAQFVDFTFIDFKGLEVVNSANRTVDWYIYTDKGFVLTVYTEYGDGPTSFRFPQLIRNMLASLDYNPDVDPREKEIDYSVLKSQIFANVLVEGKGKEMLDLLPDKIIVETDTIGVGTGPVDYYYSVGMDITFKYERSTDVILDKRDGKTTAF